MGVPQHEVWELARAAVSRGRSPLHPSAFTCAHQLCWEPASTGTASCAPPAIPRAGPCGQCPTAVPRPTAHPAAGQHGASGPFPPRSCPVAISSSSGCCGGSARPWGGGWGCSCFGVLLSLPQQRVDGRSRPGPSGYCGNLGSAEGSAPASAGMCGCSSVGWGDGCCPGPPTPDAPRQPRPCGGHEIFVPSVPAGPPVPPRGAAALAGLTGGSGSHRRPRLAVIAPCFSVGRNRDVFSELDE